MSEALQRRARAARARARVRAWKYRQRSHAAGTWYRLRRVLADARTAYLISEREAERLQAEGSSAEPVGAELEPPKVLLWLTPAQEARLDPGAQTPVKLSAQLLAARHIALAPFEPTRSSTLGSDSGRGPIER